MARAKRRIGIVALLEWAFVNECAELDFGKEREMSGRGYGMGMEWVLLERAKLGTQIDTSRSRSSCHEDADTVALAVAHLPKALGGQQMARWIYTLARARSTPEWMPDAVPFIRPVAWRNTAHGPVGKTAVCEILWESSMTPHPKNPTKHIIRKRKVEVLWTPCVWEPSLQEIESARADYTAWRRAIIEIAGALRYMKLFEHELTGELPPLNPWETPAGGSRRASTPSP